MNPLPKIDLCQLHKADYVAPKKPVLLTIASAQYLVIDGQGAPGGKVFQTRIGALYGIAFTVKMTRKFAGHQDYTVSKLEAQYLSCCAQTQPEQWRWKLLIRTPEFITRADLQQAAAALLKKGKAPEVNDVHLETIAPGPCVQLLHVGPYDQVEKAITVMKTFAGQKGLKLTGPHHEIYVSDPRRVAPEKLKTIIREPVAPA